MASRETNNALCGLRMEAQSSDLGHLADSPAVADSLPLRRAIVGGQERAIFLDRDGTINVDKHYLNDVDQLELLPGAAAGLRRLSDLKFKLVVVTNQSGIERGLITPHQLASIHRRLHQILEDEGVILDGIYVCPHEPASRCRCRKPEIGLAVQAARDFAIDLAASFVVGDKLADIELGNRIGARSILVETGYGEQTLQENQADWSVSKMRPPAAIVANLEGVAEFVMRSVDARSEAA